MVPARCARSTRKLVLGGLVIALVAALGLAVSQRLISTAFFEWNHKREFGGVLRARPVPHPKVASTNGTTTIHRLVAPWKLGFDQKTAVELDGRLVQVNGKRIFGDQQSMIEVAPAAVTEIDRATASPVEMLATSPGQRTLVSEIVGSKSWLGVMNPGRLTTHRACAARCISGGIPPTLVVEDLPDPENRVTLDRDGNIVLAYRPNNEEGHKRLIKKLESVMHFQTKCPHHGHHCHQGLFARNRFIGQRIPLAGGAYENGTIRFGHDPTTSALDRNCKAHELGNLYVVDASFFPASGAVNPALTIVANALRVGEHLLERMNARSVEFILTQAEVSLSLA